MTKKNNTPTRPKIPTTPTTPKHGERGVARPPKIKPPKK